MDDINNTALIAVYALAPPRWIEDYNLMKLTTETQLNKLDDNYNYIIIQNNEPTYDFIFLNHKTKKHNSLKQKNTTA